MADPFEILGVARDAPDEVVRRIYRRLAFEHHPDRNPSDPEAASRFVRIKHAYEAICMLRGYSAHTGRRAASPPPAKTEQPARPPPTPPSPPPAPPTPPLPAQPRRASSPASRRDLSMSDLEKVEQRLRQLDPVIQSLIDAPKVTRALLSEMAEGVQWTRFYVNVALAFKRQVHPLRDEAWASATFTNEAQALQLLAKFRDAARRVSAANLDLAELWNLFARVEGLRTVVLGWREVVT